MLVKIILTILGALFVIFMATIVVLFCYETWKESELRDDILKKMKQRQKMKSNQQWLSTLSPDEWMSTVDWLFHEYAKGFADTNIAVEEWLKKRHGDL